MKSFTALFFFILAHICYSCETIKITSDYDHGVDFNKYKTFSFTKEATQLPTNDLVRRRILDALSKTITSRGLVEVTQNPDLLVDLNLRLESKQQTSASSINMGGFYGRRWGMNTGFTTTQINTTDYTEGTLIINMVDATKQELVWTGSGTSTVTERSVQQDKLETGIKKILSKFPPVGKK